MPPSHTVTLELTVLTVAVIFAAWQALQIYILKRYPDKSLQKYLHQRAQRLLVSLQHGIYYFQHKNWR